MAALVDDYKFSIPFRPPLFHLALVQVAHPYVRFYIQGFQHISKSSPGQTLIHYQQVMYNRTKVYLPSLPGQRLRMYLEESILGMVQSFDMWVYDHYHIFKYDLDYSVYCWRPDGTIDRNKTAENLVVNKKLDIVDRYKMACWYSLEKSIDDLWEEAKACGQTEILEELDIPSNRYWFRWIPFNQEAVDHINSLPISLIQVLAHFPRFSTFFSSSSSEDRRKLFKFLPFADIDDLRFCLYAMTGVEEEECMKRCIRQVLELYLMTWPLQSSFLEIADKFWQYIDVSCFGNSLSLIAVLMCRGPHLNYWKIFEEFWNKGPDHFKASAMERISMGLSFDFCLETIKRKKNEEPVHPERLQV